MNVNEITDLEINRSVRRVFVKHWIDLGRISVRTTRGNVMLYGTLQRIESHREDLRPTTVEQMMYEIRRIKGLHLVRSHFDNWVSESGHWKPLDTKRTSDPADSGLPPAGARATAD